MRADPSEQPVTSRLPSLEKATECTVPSWRSTCETTISPVALNSSLTAAAAGVWPPATTRPTLVIALCSAAWRLPIVLSSKSFCASSASRRALSSGSLGVAADPDGLSAVPPSAGAGAASAATAGLDSGLTSGLGGGGGGSLAAGGVTGAGGLLAAAGLALGGVA